MKITLESSYYNLELVPGMVLLDMVEQKRTQVRKSLQLAFQSLAMTLKIHDQVSK